MPRGDGTGPVGMGPMTGRRAGYCAGAHEPGFLNRAWGNRHYCGGHSGGWGKGHCDGTRGGGWGHRFRYHETGQPGWQRSAAVEQDYAPSTDVNGAATSSSQLLESIKAQIDHLERSINALKNQLQDAQAATNDIESNQPA